jgi:hypothetical protein
MIKNEQAIRALREILTHIESAEVRADAIFELMLERGQINRQELEGVMERQEPGKRLNGLRSGLRWILFCKKKPTRRLQESRDLTQFSVN